MKRGREAGLWAIIQIVCITLMVIMLPAADCTGAGLLTSEFQVTSNPGIDTTPTLGADTLTRLVVYTNREMDGSGGWLPGVVFYQRISKTATIGAPIQISDGLTSDYLNDVSGDYIVYTAYTDPAHAIGEIKLYTISTGTTTSLSAPGVVREARIYDNHVAWTQGTVGATTVYLVDLDAPFPLPTAIASGYQATNINVGDTLVVWSEATSDGLPGIWGHDLRTGVTAPVANDPAMFEFQPSTIGTWVVYMRYPGDLSTTGDEIVLYNVDTAEERVIAAGPASHALPSMDGDFVAYEGNEDGNFDIYLYEISKGLTHQVTVTPPTNKMMYHYDGLVERDFDPPLDLSSCNTINFSIEDSHDASRLTSGQVVLKMRKPDGTYASATIDLANEDSKIIAIARADFDDSTFDIINHLVFELDLPNSINLDDIQCANGTIIDDFEQYADQESFFNVWSGTNRCFSLDNNSPDHRLNNIFGDQIAYVDNRDGDFDVYVTTFELLRTLTVNKSGAGSGTVTSVPSGIDCGTDCTEDFPMGSEVVLTAAPDPGFYFERWEGCDNPSGNTCSMTMGSDMSVTAHFSAWLIETTGGYPGAGGYTSIAIDSSDNIHISYIDAFNGYLKYIKKTGSVWSAPETPDSSGNVGIYNSIAVDSSGDAHICYYDASNGYLKYIKQTGGIWGTSETLDNTGDVGLFNSIAVDLSGDIHISYYDASGGDLKYVKKSGDAWGVPEILDSTGDVGLFSSIVLDLSGDAHISYFDASSGYLKYIKQTGGIWGTSEHVAYSNGYISSVIDSAGNVHISYQYGSDLMYIRNTGGVWGSPEMVDNGGDSDIYETSIALDPAGNVHISYHTGYRDYDLKYASHDSGIWVSQTVDSDGDVGGYPSIATDASGGVHISYTDNTNNAIKYAYFSGNLLTINRTGSGSGTVTSVPSGIDCGTDCTAYYPDGTSVTLTAAPDAGYDFGGWNGCDSASGSTCTMNMTADRTVTAIFTPFELETLDSSSVHGSLALDSSGNVHICYIGDDGALKYITNASGDWVNESVYSNAMSCSIALDPSDNVHIGYSGYSFVSYTTNASGPWTTEQVDTTIIWPGKITTAVDSSGNVHIAYNSYDDIHFTANLHYATNSSGSWNRVRLNSLSTLYGTGSSMALDSSDNVHISYESGNGLEYAACPSTADCLTLSSWASDIVDGSVSEDVMNSIAIDSSDVVHISYYDSTSRDLKYATGAPGAWSIETVDSTGDVGLYTSIALDPSDNVHISYIDSDKGNLKHAAGTYGSWAVETVAAQADSGTSIAVDASYGVHISYADPFNIKYAYLPGYLLSVNKVGSGSGLVTSNPAGIDCGTDCSEDYTRGTAVTLTALPDAGSVFVNWIGAPDCTDGVVAMDMAKTCTATFELLHTLTVNKTGTGSGLITSDPPGIDCGLDCTEEFALGTDIELYTVPDTGSYFIGWSGAPDCTDGVVTIASDINCSAEFSSDYPDLTVLSISTDPVSPAAGQSISVTITVENQGTLSASNFYVHFYEDLQSPPLVNDFSDYYCLINTLEPGATTTCGISYTYGAGGSYSMWAQADTNNNVDESDEGNNVFGPQTITVADQFQLTTPVSPSGNGSVSPDCSAGCLYNSGTVVVLTANENSGYPFTGWSGCDSPSGSTCTMTMDADKNVTAEFDACMYPVRVLGASTSYYDWLQDAYDNASNGDTVQCRAANVTDGYFETWADKSVVLEGGYNCDFTEIIDTTPIDAALMQVIDGSITIQNGAFEVR